MRSNVARPSTHHLLLGCALVVALAAATPTALQAQLIKFTQCNFTATLGTPLDMVMVYEGPTDISGISVRLTGVPTAWIRVVTPPPNIIDVCGPGGCDLFGNGANLTFSSCQTNSEVLLYQLTFIPTTEETELVFTPEKTLDSPIDCPYVVHCDDPVFTLECVGCDQAFVNHPNNACGLPVEESTWSSVRNLYR